MLQTAGWMVAAGWVACLGFASAQSVVYFSGIDAGTAAGPNSSAAAANFESSAALLGNNVLRRLDFESMTLGLFLNLSPAGTGAAGLSILGAESSSGTDTSITNEVFAAEGFNITSGGANFLKLEENQSGEPAIGVTFDFAMPVVAFGLYITGADPAVAGAVSALFDDGAPQVVPLDGIAGGGAQFWGFTDPSQRGISRVTIVVAPEAGINGDALGLDDVTWVTIPEPASLPLILLAVIGLARRRR